MLHTSHCGAVIKAVFHWPDSAATVRDFLFPPLDSTKTCARPVGPWCALNSESGTLEFAVYPENVAAMLTLCREKAYAFTFYAANL